MPLDEGDRRRYFDSTRGTPREQGMLYTYGLLNIVNYSLTTQSIQLATRSSRLISLQPQPAYKLIHLRGAALQDEITIERFAFGDFAGDRR